MILLYLCKKILHLLRMLISLSCLCLMNGGSMVLNGEQTRLCDYLIRAHKKKFEFELNSNIYIVASILNVSDLYIWYRTALFKEYVSAAFNTLSSVVYEIIEKSNTVGSEKNGDQSIYNAYEAQNITTESNGTQDSNLSDSSREFSQYTRYLKRNCGTNEFKDAELPRDEISNRERKRGLYEISHNY
jgi:hypothetical protein